MASLLKLLLTLLVGGALGLASAFWAVGGQPPFGAIGSGPWTARPTAGGPDADPYARAILGRDGRIPLSPASGVRFLARTDSDGRTLNGGCSYAVSGPTPAAAAWTLTVLDAAGFPASPGSGRAGFTSAELVRSADGGFVIALAPSVQPGNWLPSRGGPMLLMLSLYDTPLGTALRMGGKAPPLPTIAPQGCP